MQQVKDLALSLQWLGLLLWHRLNPHPKNFHMLWGQPKKSKIKMTPIFLLVGKGKSLTKLKIKRFFLPQRRTKMKEVIPTIKITAQEKIKTSKRI